MFKNLSPDEKVTLMEHLEDLRKALLISLVAIVAAACVCFSYSDEILDLIKQPLTNLDLKLYYIGVAEGFFIKLKLSLIAGLVVAFPIVSAAIWRFIKPALYPNERKYVYILFPITVLLFAGGVIFAYESVLQLALRFLVYISGGLEPMITVEKYVSFVIAFTIPFGFVFELPVVVYFLTKLGIIGPEVLIRNRKYAILVIFILAAAMTPGPDPVSQCLMALPVWGLYEVSVVISKLVKPSRERENDKDAAGTEGKDEERIDVEEDLKEETEEERKEGVSF